MELEIRGLTLSYPRQKDNVLENISLELERGEVGIVLGKNGIGKSTLFKSIMGLLKFKEGEILLEGKGLNEYKQNELAKVVSFLPQQVILPSRTVIEEVTLGRLPFSPLFSSKQDHQKAKEALEIVGISNLMNKFCDELSGGEIQKVGIARSLASQSSLVLMDEPTSSLDLKSSLSLASTIKNLAIKNHITFLISIHDIHLASKIGSKFFLMKDKEIICSGGKEILNRENIIRTFDLDNETLEEEKDIDLFTI